jgi:hypothetical protein
MSEHKQLDVPLIPRAPPCSENTAYEEIEDREQHGSPFDGGERMLLVLRVGGSGILNPSGHGHP